MRRLLTSGFLILHASVLSAQQVVPLYQDQVPNSKPCDEKDHEFIDTSWNKNGLLIVDHITKPTLAIYKPAKEKRNGTAVIICPGGGYAVLAAGHEGADVARAFNDVGITAFVLRYRLPKDACMTSKAFVPLMDAQQAIWFVRTHANQYGVNIDRIGIMGFSAGGHLASTAGTHVDPVRKDLGNATLRPAFMILIYPVISFNDSIGHIGSRDNLLGKNPDKHLVQLFSNELQVNPQTPPTFLVHASDDDGVVPENSIRFYQALLRNKVPAELHLYEHGGHGFGLHNPSTKQDWFKACVEWMRTNKLIP
ncbi:MAG: alpha/beta hydrolase [Bacteroidetes bacterium]|nr:MAG: alpha/beta hydrolase [Bacteroidota bacterium]